MPETRRFLTGKLPSLWTVMIASSLLAAVPRFIWMINGQYNRVLIIFSFFIALPFILLPKTARREIGFRSIKFSSLIWVFICGFLASLMVYFIGYLFFRHTSLHWFVVVMTTFDTGNLIEQIRSNFLFFLLFSLPVMTFSPLGEEFFFRGLLHESISSRWSNSTALIVDTSFFGITHLAHYGTIKQDNSYTLLPSAILWVVLMMLTAALFYWVKKKTGSIWGAVVCHAGFNFAMMFCIFYLIH